MTKMYLGISIALVALFSCQRSQNEEDSNHMILEGTALDLKGRACIILNDVPYYLDGDYRSNKDILEKRGQIEGELFVVILPPRPPRDTVNVPPLPPLQRSAYDFELMIKKPKWRESNGAGNYFALTGTAQNFKSNAVVISDSITYYVDGVDAWDQIILNKKRIRRVSCSSIIFLRETPPNWHHTTQARH